MKPLLKLYVNQSIYQTIEIENDTELLKIEQ